MLSHSIYEVLLRITLPIHGANKKSMAMPTEDESAPQYEIQERRLCMST